MTNWQQILVAIYGLINLVVFFKGFYECKYKKNAYGLIPSLTFLGIFAWGDAVVFGLFWTAVSLITLIINNWYLFLLILSVFWFIRSLGETIYWFNQQFSTKAYEWNKPENLSFHSVFHNDSIWYVYQIGWQCVSVVSLILSIYFGYWWIQSF